MITKPREGRRVRIRKDRMRQLGRRKFGVETNAALSVCLGIDAGNLSNLISGRKQPSLRTVLYLLDVFDVDLDDLFERYEPTPTDPPPRAEAA